MEDGQAIWAPAFAVTAGTTRGMMIANVPAVLLGHELIKRIPLNIVRIIAVTLFVIIGLWMLAETAGLFG